MVPPNRGGLQITPESIRATEPFACAAACLSTDQRRAAFATQNRRDRTWHADRKHDDRHTVFPGKREGGGVHDLQIAIERVLMAEPVIAFRFGVLLWVSA